MGAQLAHVDRLSTPFASLEKRMAVPSLNTDIFSDRMGYIDRRKSRALAVVLILALANYYSPATNGQGVVALRCDTVLAELTSATNGMGSPLRRRYENFLTLPLNEVPFLGIGDLAPALRTDLNRISSDFSRSPQGALDHIVDGVLYSDWTTGSHRLNGGMHSWEGRRRLLSAHMADLGFSIENDANRDQIVRQQRYILSHPEDTQHIEMRILNLDPAKLEDVYFYLLAHDKSHVGPLLEPNGVIRFQFGRAVFSRKKWKDSVRVAEWGLAPAGAKTLFPAASWPKERIKSATIQILNSPTTRLLSLSSSNDHESIRLAMLEGEADGVVITVAIAGGRVVTAYPSWIQNRRQTVREVLNQRNYYYSRAHDRVWELAHDIDISTPFPDLTDAISIYAGRRPERIIFDHIQLSTEDFNLLNQYLNPAMRANGRQDQPNGNSDAEVRAANLYRLGGAAQNYIEHFLLNWRLIQDIN